MDMNEKNLVKSASAGDKEAFALLYERYKDELYRYAYFRLGDPDDAHDAVSMCIVSAYESIYSLRSAAAFKAWIFKILYYACCKLTLQQSEMRSRADISELERIPDENTALSPELNEAFGVLDLLDKDIVLLSVIAGYNSREIAAMTGIKSNTVRSRLSRALAKMKHFLEV